MSLTTITLQGELYEAYATEDEANTYLLPDLNRFPAWDALDADAKNTRLILATRRLDQITGWVGEPSTDTQATAWPRKDTQLAGVTDTTIPVALEQATILLAGTIATNLGAAGVPAAVQTGSGIKKVMAGSVSVEYFRNTPDQPNPVEGLGDQDALQLIRRAGLLEVPQPVLAAAGGTSKQPYSGRDYGVSEDGI